MSQEALFLEKEADFYFERNIEQWTMDELYERDTVLPVLSQFGLSSKRFLMIGASNCRRLELIRQIFGAECHGVEPSRMAVEYGRRNFPELTIKQGTADILDYPDSYFDCVMFGMCLYLCSRNRLFSIAAEADRVLQNGGFLVINDFLPDFPYRNPYVHQPGIYSYKMDYSSMFLWNPDYRRVSEQAFLYGGDDAHPVDGRFSVSILKKDTELAYPENPYFAS